MKSFSQAIVLVNPNTFNWVLEEFMGINIINALLGVIIFGMDTKLKIEHFEIPQKDKTL